MAKTYTLTEVQRTFLNSLNTPDSFIGRKKEQRTIDALWRQGFIKVVGQGKAGHTIYRVTDACKDAMGWNTPAPAAETPERARITPADAVALLGDDESETEWTPAVGNTVRIKDHVTPKNLRGMVGKIVSADDASLPLPYFVTTNGRSDYFSKDEIEFVEPTPAPVEPLGELEALRTAMREIKRILAEEVSWQQAPFIRDLMEDLEL